MDGSTPSETKRCSWCGALNSIDERACAKCGAVLSAIRSPTEAPALNADTPHRAEAARGSLYQEVNEPAFDATLIDKQTSEAIRSIGLGPSFQSGRTRGLFAVGCLSVYILLCLVGLVSDFSRIGTLPKGGSGLTEPSLEAMAIDAQAVLIRLLQSASVMLAAVCFLVWIYGAHKNLKAIGATDLKYSAGWAVGYFFIPLLNIVRPYQVVMEIWRASRYEAGRWGGQAWSYSDTPIFVAVWWGSWVLLGVLDSLGFTMFGAIGADLVATRYRIVYYVVGAASAALAITVILKINARQEDSHRRIWTKTMHSSAGVRDG